MRAPLPILLLATGVLGQSPAEGLYDPDWQYRNATAKKILAASSVPFAKLLEIAKNRGHEENQVPDEAVWGTRWCGRGTIPKERPAILLGYHRRDREVYPQLTSAKALVMPWSTRGLAAFLAAPLVNSPIRLELYADLFEDRALEHYVIPQIVARGAAVVPFLERNMQFPSRIRVAMQCLERLGKKGHAALERIAKERKHPGRLPMLCQLSPKTLDASPVLRAQVLALALRGPTERSEQCFHSLREVRQYPTEHIRLALEDDKDLVRRRATGLVALWAARGDAQKATELLATKLIDRLSDQDRYTQGYAMAALRDAKLSGDPATTAATWIERRLQEDAVFPRRAYTVELLLRTISHLQDVDRLAGLALTAWIVGRFERLTTEHKPAALGALGTLPQTPSSLALLRKKAAKAVTQEVRLAALRSLGQSHDNTAETIAVLKKLFDERRAIRVAAVFAYVDVGAPDLRVVHKHAPYVPYAPWRAAAATPTTLGARLGRLAPGRDADLLPWFDEKLPTLRRIAADYFAAHKNPPQAALDGIERMLDDKDTDVVATAIEALVRLAPKSLHARRHLRTFVGKDGKRREVLLRTARHLGPDVRKALFAATRKALTAKADGRWQLLHRVDLPPHDAAWQALMIAALNDPDTAVARLAFAALARLPAPSPLVLAAMHRQVERLDMDDWRETGLALLRVHGVLPK